VSMNEDGWVVGWRFGFELDTRNYNNVERLLILKPSSDPHGLLRLLFA
jgi:hypothetical protein